LSIIDKKFLFYKNKILFSQGKEDKRMNMIKLDLIYSINYFPDIIRRKEIRHV